MDQLSRACILLTLHVSLLVICHIVLRGGEKVSWHFKCPRFCGQVFKSMQTELSRDS